jgi:hypothetical protein
MPANSVLHVVVVDEIVMLVSAISLGNIMWRNQWEMNVSNLARTYTKFEQQIQGRFYPLLEIH